MNLKAGKRDMGGKKEAFVSLFSHTLLDRSATRDKPQHKAYKADSECRSILLCPLQTVGISKARNSTKGYPFSKQNKMTAFCLTIQTSRRALDLISPLMRYKHVVDSSKLCIYLQTQVGQRLW